MPMLDVFRAASKWILFNWLTSLLKNRISEYRVVSYETLAHNPKATICEILKWIGVDQPTLEYFINGRLVRLGVNHTLSGNLLRFKQGEIQIQPDREWVEKMYLTKKYIVTALTYYFLRTYTKRGQTK